MPRSVPAIVASLLVSSAIVVAAQAPPVLPGASTRAFSTIYGSALSASSAVLPATLVRLRDVRTGRIVATTVTDKSGAFVFRAVDPGSFIVELMAPDQSTIWAASQILNVNAGDAVAAVVKIPFRISPFAGLLAHKTAAAVALSAIAAASGVLATEVTGEPVSANR